jgi:membrane protease YdiL (CAAX protease family)
MSSDSEMSPFEPPPDEIEAASEFWASDDRPMLSEPVSTPRPWGPWATIGWTFLCILVMSIIQFGVLKIFAASQFAAGQNLKIDKLVENGNFLAAATAASTPAIVGLVAFLIWARGCRIRDYLAFVWPDARLVVLAFIGLGVVLVASDLVMYWLRRPIVPQFMVGIYRTSWLPILLFAIVVMAPVGEEILFRGFLYHGIAVSRWGHVAAILGTTAVFALLHSQYDWYGIVSVAVIGLYLGVVRHQTGSVLLTMSLHAVANAYATVEVIVQENWLS